MRASTSAFVLPLLWLGLGVAEAAGPPGPSPDDLVLVGKELFHREWVANDPRAHGGDGLGPVYNAASCVACHSQGGAGGGGDISANVRIVTPFSVIEPGKDRPAPAGELARLVREQTGLPTVGSFVLHHHGTDPAYKAWSSGVPGLGGKANGFMMRISRRNTPALFGAGLIDAIPGGVLEHVARRQAAEAPEIQGRVSRLADGKLGRFGWKGQTASLADFVLTACSVELGLEVPGHPQSPDPSRPKRRAPGPDLNGPECDALIAYVRSLPAPERRPPANSDQVLAVAAGSALFTTIGCAGCHVPDLGAAQGIYSDLLLHDMGPDSSDGAVYYGPTPVDEITEGRLADARPSTSDGEVVGASAGEWRTPPLWGLRDSAPYLHDGRAVTIDAAILGHGGQAAMVRQRYTKLTAGEKAQLRSFLWSLAAPRARHARGRKVAVDGPRGGTSDRLEIAARLE